MELLYIGKILQALLLPPGLFVLFLFSAYGYMLYKKQSGRSAVLLAAFLVYVLSLNPVAYTLVKPLERMYLPQASDRAEAIVMLGGGAVPGTPGLAGEGNLSGSAANRLLMAAALQKRTGLPVIVSGGQVYSYTANEAQTAKQQLLLLGVPENKILTEDKARNTQENARYVAALCAKHNFSSVYLVTSAFHMPRSVTHFRKAFVPHGMRLAPVSCDYQMGERLGFTPFALLPQMDALFISQLAIKEYLGLVAAMLP